MTLLHETIEVERSVDEAFAAVADFSTSAVWDPGVASAARVREGSPAPAGVGAEYLLTVVFRGRSSDMRYRTTRYDAPSIVVLEGKGPRIAATDTIRFEAGPDGGTRIDYVADLRLTGLARLAQPLLRGAFTSMGSRALAGMKAWLDRRP